MPFRNDTTDGIGNLVVDSIRSPNYVPGVTGWSINKNGSAEFNDGTFRGSLDVTGTVTVGPAGEPQILFETFNNQGQIIFHMNDPKFFDSTFGMQIENPGAANEIANATLATPGLTSYGFGGVGVAQIEMNGQAADNSQGPSIILALNRDNTQTPEVSFETDADGGFHINAVDMQFGAGNKGKYYNFQGSWSIANVPSGSGFTQIPSFTNDFQHSDYPGVDPTTGLFTAPVDGFYLAFLLSVTTGAVAHEAVIENNGAVVAECGTSNRGNVSVFWMGWVFAGQNLKFLVSQTSGANNNMSGKMAVARML